MSLAVKQLQHLSSDPEARRIADARERDLLAHGHFVASAHERGREEGIALGKEEGIALGKKEGIALGEARGEARGMLVAIEAAAEILGVELTAERRRELDGLSAEALRERLARLRRERAWG